MTLDGALLLLQVRIYVLNDRLAGGLPPLASRLHQVPDRAALTA